MITASFLKLISMTFFSLFPVVNPIGTSFIIYGMAATLSPEKYKRLALQISIFTAVFLLIVLLLGTYFLKVFGLSIAAVQVGGGLVLMSIGWRLLNKEEVDTQPQDSRVDVGDSLNGKAFYPLTFPMTTGPGALAVILTISAHSKSTTIDSSLLNYLAASIGVLAMGVCVYLFYVYLPRITTRLSRSGLNALSKILAFVIVCIGVDILLGGMKSFLHG